MFLEITDISTGVPVQEPLNAYTINYVYSRQEDSKYKLIYVLTNGIRKIEEFNSQSDLNDRIAEIKEISGGGGTNVYTYKGSCTFENLPTSDQVVGDVWNITNDFTLGGKSYPAGTNVAWDGSGWDALAGSIDLSNYYTKAEVDELVASAGAITVELGEAAGIEIMQELMSTGKAVVNIDSTTYPNAYASLAAVFDSADLGTKNVNISLSDSVFDKVLIPVEVNSASPGISAALAGAMPFGEDALFNIQINPQGSGSSTFYRASMWLELFEVRPLPVKQYDGTTVNLGNNFVTIQFLRSVNSAECPGSVRMSNFTVYDDDVGTFIEMGSGLLLFNTFPSDPVDTDTMTATFYGDRRNAVQASFELLIETDSETQLDRLGIQNYHTYNNVLYYDGTTTPDTATLNYLSYYVALNDDRAHKVDTGLFTVYDSDLEDNRELGTGTLIFKYDSAEDNFVCTFYGEGSQSTFLLTLDTDEVTGDTVLVISDYSNLTETIGNINAILSTLTTPSAVEQALREI